MVFSLKAVHQGDFLVRYIFICSNLFTICQGNILFCVAKK